MPGTRHYPFFLGTQSMFGRTPAFAAILFSVVATANAKADLIVAPQRYIFDERTRETTITLVNRGAESATYRASLENYRALSDGKYQPITSTTSPTGERFAHKYIRFSPREVTLKPGESQLVRLMLRLPANLPEGELRSHLRFTQVPTATPLTKRAPREPGQPHIGLSLQMNYSVAIPIIIRLGRTAATVDISDLRAEPQLGAKKKLFFTLHRQGNRSVYGNLRVSFVPQNTGEEIVVGELNGVSVLTPNAVREVSMPLAWPEKYPATGVLTVTFRNAETNDAYTLAEAKLEL